MVLAMVSLAPGDAAGARTLRVAVASNFVVAAREIVRAYARDGGDVVVLVPGSSGRHYAQIRQGAPFDLLLSADVERPRRLEEAGFGVPGSRFTYARGRLILWICGAAGGERTASEGAVPESIWTGLPEILGERRLSIANPRLAPYGRAARETLGALGLWARLEPRLVQGENVAQAFHFVHGGTAGAGLVAASQLIAHSGAHGSACGGRVWSVPDHLHAPVEQQALQLSDSAAAARFMRFLAGERARRIITTFGYGIPDAGGG